MKHRSSFAAVAAAAFVVAAPLSAQSRTVTTSNELETAVASRPSSREVPSILRTPAALAAAARMGLDASNLEARMATLDQATLAQVSALAASANTDQALAGGAGTIVISTTLVIIILLLIIILA